MASQDPGVVKLIITDHDDKKVRVAVDPQFVPVLILFTQKSYIVERKRLEREDRWVWVPTGEKKSFYKSVELDLADEDAMDEKEYEERVIGAHKDEHPVEKLLRRLGVRGVAVQPEDMDELLGSLNQKGKRNLQ